MKDDSNAGIHNARENEGMGWQATLIACMIAAFISFEFGLYYLRTSQQKRSSRQAAIVRPMYQSQHAATAQLQQYATELGLNQVDTHPVLVSPTRNWPTPPNHNVAHADHQQDQTTQPAGFDSQVRQTAMNAEPNGRNVMVNKKTPLRLPSVADTTRPVPVIRVPRKVKTQNQQLQQIPHTKPIISISGSSQTLRNPFFDQEK